MGLCHVLRDPGVGLTRTLSDLALGLGRVTKFLPELGQSKVNSTFIKSGYPAGSGH
jgi:hypothetical protein